MTRTPRRIASILLAVLGTVVLVGGFVLVWVDANVFDTDQVVATTHEMLAQPSIRSLVENELDQRIQGMVDPKYDSVVTSTVKTVLDDPRFEPILENAVRQVHQTLVNGDAEQLTFSLAAVIPIVESEVAKVSPELAAQLPGQLQGSLDYVLTRRSQLPAAWSALKTLHRAAGALVLLGAALVGLALVIGPDRWSLLILAGVLAVVALLLGHLGIAYLRHAVDRRIDEPGTRQAADDVTSLFTGPLSDRLTLVGVIGGLAIVAGIVLGIVRMAVTRRPPPPTPWNG